MMFRRMYERMIMVTFEERLLEFLDGVRSNGAPLDDPSSEEFMREIAESPDKRRVFSEHLKLRDILAAGQKPSSAPLAVQRELAQKLPILALSLPYLAQERRRSRLAAFWQSNLTMLRVGMILLTFGIITTVWYASRTNAPNQNANLPARLGTEAHSSNTAQGSGALPQSISSRSGELAANTHSNTYASSAGSAPGKMLGGSAHASHAAASYRASNTGSVPVEHRLQGIQNHSLASSQTYNKASGPQIRSDNSNAGSSDVSMPTDRNEQSEGARDVSGKDNQSVGVIHSLTSLRSTNVEAPGQSAPHARLNSLTQFDDQHGGRISAWIAPTASLRFLPAVHLTESALHQNFTTATGPTVSGAYWLGADYDLDGTWFVEARVGRTTFARMQSITYSEHTPGYPLLLRYKRETRLQDTSSVAFGPGIGYKLPPIGAADIMVRAYGAMGGAGLNWISGVDVAMEYSISNSFKLRGTVGGDVTSAGVMSAGGEPLPRSFTLGVQERGTPTQTLLVPSLNIAIGISYQP
jgi:hypothetical protein